MSPNKWLPYATMLFLLVAGQHSLAEQTIVDFGTDIVLIEIHGSFVSVALDDGRFLLVGSDGTVNHEMSIPLTRRHLTKHVSQEQLLIFFDDDCLSSSGIVDDILGMLSETSCVEFYDIAGQKWVFRHEHKGFAVAIDYSPRSGLLAICAVHGRDAYIEVIDVRSGDVLGRRPCNTGGHTLVLADSTLYLVNWRSIDVYQINSEGYFTRERTELLGILLHPDLIFRDVAGRTNHLDIYNSSIDTTLGPIRLVADSSLVSQARQLIPAQFDTAFYSYQRYSGRQLFLNFDYKRLVVLDFVRQIVTEYEIREFIGEDMLGVIVPLENGRSVTVPFKGDDPATKLVIIDL